MLRNRFYYGLKPYLPWRVRMAMRRIAARHKRAAFSSTWPIDPAAAAAPIGWPGWPDGKKFAFVLTHDVEGPFGLTQTQRLAETELELGFRSSFNFIPEGPYSVPPALRAWLTDHGFEVGVHDLNHDGKLFGSKGGFEKKADRINHHLRDWGAAGFRSGFMLRNLEWLQRLDLRYDCSTFDTDPFEPQAGGAGTIFPFWMPCPPDFGTASPLPGPSSAAARGGYLELPYTLAQDSTIFLVLGETSPEIWLRKLDWIAAHGGMALVNVHPDYLHFGEGRAPARTYPAAHYLELLRHVRARHGDTFWQPLPGQLAEFATAVSPPLAIRRAKRIAMITHSFYESDNRVTRYAEALAERGDQVDVFALRRSPASPREELLGGVHVHRLQYRLSRTRTSKFAYAWQLLRFFLLSTWHMTREHARAPYQLVHVHNMPDFLIFAAWYPRLGGVKLILDIHDIVPELYSSKFAAGRAGKAEPVLKWMERRSARFAHHRIISNDLWLEKYATRTGTRGGCSVFIKNVDSRTFQPRPRERADERLIVLFPGGLQWHQGLDIAIRAFVRVSRELPRAEFHIYGDGNMKPSLIALAAELGLAEKVRFFEARPIAEIARVMAGADLGVVPKRADSFGNEAYSTKIMEFMSVGVPVVISRTKIDQFYFNDAVARFFDSGNETALAEAMLEVLGDAALRQRMVTAASAYAAQHSWNSRKTDYLRLVDSLSGQSVT